MANLHSDFHSRMGASKELFSAEDGAVLREVKQGIPPEEGTILGMVIASPNIPRELHTGFDPFAPMSDRFGDEYFDRILYVERDDLADGLKLKAAINLSHQLAILQRALDAGCACGCACGGDGTPVFRALFHEGQLTGFERLPGTYTVIAAAFAEPCEKGHRGPMTIKEYWMARSDTDERFVLIKHDAFQKALERHRNSRPSDCDVRREKLHSLLKRIRSV